MTTNDTGIRGESEEDDEDDANEDDVDDTAEKFGEEDDHMTESRPAKPEEPAASSAAPVSTPAAPAARSVRRGPLGLAAAPVAVTANLGLGPDMPLPVKTQSAKAPAAAKIEAPVPRAWDLALDGIVLDRARFEAFLKGSALMKQLSFEDFADIGDVCKIAAGVRGHAEDSLRGGMKPEEAWTLAAKRLLQNAYRNRDKMNEQQLAHVRALAQYFIWSLACRKGAHAEAAYDLAVDWLYEQDEELEQRQAMNPPPQIPDKASAPAQPAAQAELVQPVAKPEPPAQAQPAPAKTTCCYNCGTSNAAGAICAKCGADTSKAPAVKWGKPKDSTEAKPADSVECARCCGANLQDAKFCKFCAAPLYPEPAKAQSVPKPAATKLGAPPPPANDDKLLAEAAAPTAVAERPRIQLMKPPPPAQAEVAAPAVTDRPLIPLIKPQSAPLTTGPLICPRCGRGNPLHLQFCNDCGTLLRQKPPEARPPQAEAAAPAAPEQPAARVISVRPEAPDRVTDPFAATREAPASHPSLAAVSPQINPPPPPSEPEIQVSAASAAVAVTERKSPTPTNTEVVKRMSALSKQGGFDQPDSTVSTVQPAPQVGDSAPDTAAKAPKEPAKAIAKAGRKWPTAWVVAGLAAFCALGMGFCWLSTPSQESEAAAKAPGMVCKKVTPALLQKYLGQNDPANYRDLGASPGKPRIECHGSNIVKKGPKVFDIRPCDICYKE